MSRAGAVRDLGGLGTADGARTVFGRVLRSGLHGGETLGEVYRGSLRRNAGNIAAILAAAAQEAAPLLVSCTAGKDRTGMICAILLDLAKVRRADIAADYSGCRGGGPGADP